MQTLSEAASDVILRHFVLRLGEYLLGISDLNKLAEMEIGRALRNARRLLH